VIGAGGIGFDVSEYLLKPEHQPQPQPLADWQREWGVDPNPNYVSEGGTQPQKFIRLFVRFIYYNVKLLHLEQVWVKLRAGYTVHS
jgi:hypothetical protein